MSRAEKKPAAQVRNQGKDRQPGAQTSGEQVLVDLAACSSRRESSLQELCPETHHWMTNYDSQSGR